MTLRRNGLKILLGALLLSSLMGCLSPIAMHRAVIEYDRTVSMSSGSPAFEHCTGPVSQTGALHGGVECGGDLRFSHQCGNTRWVRSCDGFFGAASES